MRFSKILARRRFVLELVTVLSYVLGVAWRAHFVLKTHDPRSFVYSDMELYVSLGKRLANPNYIATINDITHPPAMPWLVSVFYAHDPTLRSLVWLQFITAILVPLAIGAFAWLAMNRTTALLAVIVSSFYFPFVDYAGLFLAEIYMMLLVPATLALYLLANRVRRVFATIVIALIAGALLSAALAFKMVALPGLFMFIAAYWLLFDEHAGHPGTNESAAATPADLRSDRLPLWRRLWVWLRSKKSIAAFAFALGMTPGLVALSIQCTRVSRGHFCLVNNKGGADILLGHYGRVGSIRWAGPDGAVFQFGNPSDFQRGYKDVREVPFSMTDSKSNLREAGKWMLKHPVEALVLSIQHVYDLWGGTFPWPSIWDDYWMATETSHIGFVYLFILPSLMLCLDVFRSSGIVALARSRELLVLSPIFGVALAVFIATGEPRYRLPWDGVFITLGAEFYRQLAVGIRARRAARRASHAVAVRSNAPVEEPAWATTSVVRDEAALGADGREVAPPAT